AFSTDATGSRITSTGVDVTFGDPASQQHYAFITYPLPGTVFHSGAEIGAVAGYAGGLITNTVYLSALDAGGQIRSVLPVPVDPGTGFWSIVPGGSLRFEEDGVLNLFAVVTEPTAGQILAIDKIEVRVQRPIVTGEVLVPQDVALPPDAALTVRIVSAPDAPG